jgi:hypothetical protein
MIINRSRSADPGLAGGAREGGGGSPDGLAAAQADAGPRILWFLAGQAGAGTGDRVQGGTGA